MPLAAYFRNVGAVLLALLFVADYYWPSPAVVAEAKAYAPVIRIYSDRKAAAPVIFDTTQVVPAAGERAPWDRNPPMPPAHAKSGQGDESAVREATLHPQRAGSSVKRRHPVQRYAARGMREPAQRQIVLAARQPQFGWFGFRPW